MASLLPEDRYDLHSLIVRPLYFGMVFNVLIPAGLLLVCYWFDGRQTIYNSLGAFANTLFYIFMALALVEAGLALWWRNQSLDKPMIKTKETFEEDLGRGILERSRPVFLMVAGISLYGIVYFFLTGRFKETLVFVLFSFIVFQVVRPRLGLLRKLIVRQQQLVDEGKLAKL